MLNTTDFVRLLLQPSDRMLLERLAKIDGDTSMSALVRKLIRQEAARRGVQLADEQPENEVVYAPA